MHHLTISFVVFAALTLLSPVGATADVINACVKERNGALRLVADPSECSSRERSISWNQQGPQGEPGADGQPGVPGPAGSSLRVLDGAGQILGIPAGFDHSVGERRFFNEDLGLMVAYNTLRDQIIVSDGIFFEEPDCQGQAFIKPFAEGMGANFLIGPLPPILPKFLVSRTTVELGEQPIMSFWDITSDCLQTAITLHSWILADPFTGTLPFTIPVLEPIYIDLMP